MCGIVGVCRLGAKHAIGLQPIRRMMSPIRHRGPDETGVYLDDWIGLGHLRLSVIDLESGRQPIHNEDETLWIVYNGEIFNYVELRRELQELGHRFSTTSDTEVILHLYEQMGPRCVERLNGQFAFAIWDNVGRELFLARDRVGIRPLFYTVCDGLLLFASEIKSLFTSPDVRRELDPVSLDQIFTFWTVLPGRTPFRDVYEVPPGHYMKVSGGSVDVKEYWTVPVHGPQEQSNLPVETLCERVREILIDAIRIRLRADVPVGSYLSGGLDSSGIAALAARTIGGRLNTFGIRFGQEQFDEGVHQQRMASFLGTTHREVWARAEQIGESFRDVLWHCEKPLLRTAPAPLYMLSRIVRDHGMKVVLTGEGADEVFGGYDIFKEAKVRRFWSRHPDAPGSAALFEQLYADVFRDLCARPFLKGFFARQLDNPDDPLFSHRIRWDNTRRTEAFFSDDLRAAVGSADPYEAVRQSLPRRFHELDVVGRAQYIETMIFLSSYLLSSQGDRVAMAHSVEIRMPFLDYRLIELAARIPSKWKILGLDEKHILKRSLKPFLPPEIIRRRKQPYRAPIVECLLRGRNRDDVLERLGDTALRRVGLFNVGKVSRLVGKLKTIDAPGEIDSMALAGILSTQIIHQQFVESFAWSGGEGLQPDVVVDRRSGTVAVRRAALVEWRPSSRKESSRVVLPVRDS